MSPKDDDLSSYSRFIPMKHCYLNDINKGIPGIVVVYLWGIFHGLSNGFIPNGTSMEISPKNTVFISPKVD